MFEYFFLCSQGRYWLFLLVTLILNIIFIVYDRGARVCPTVALTNLTLSGEDEDRINYILSNFVVGAVYFILAVWMLLEFFVTNWPHFVLPKFLYKFYDILGSYALTAPFAK